MNTLTETVVPSWIAAALGVATLAMLLGMLLLIARARRAHSSAPRTSRDERILRRLFLAALVPTLVVIGAVMGISFIGLSSFARDDMGWHSWVSLVVPLSLDGISITFGFWAFVAVKRGRHPGRSEKIVYVGALISAWINFNHGRAEWTNSAGIYLGFLSLASAWMFHELLSQFMDAQHTLPKARRNGTPIFGERWLWAPLSTLMARRAWVVYPPTPDVEPSAANALVHLEAVRYARVNRRLRRKGLPQHTPNPTTKITPTTPTITHQEDRPSTIDSPPTRYIEPVTDAPPASPLPAAAVAIAAPVPSPSAVAPRITPRQPASPRNTAAASGAQRPATRTPATTPTTPAPALPASATDPSVTAPEPVQLPLPMADPELLARAADVARRYRTENGTRITPGQLAVRLREFRLSTDTAAQLLRTVDDTPTATTPPVNGTPVQARP